MKNVNRVQKNVNWSCSNIIKNVNWVSKNVNLAYDSIMKRGKLSIEKCKLSISIS